MSYESTTGLFMKPSHMTMTRAILTDTGIALKSQLPSSFYSHENSSTLSCISCASADSATAFKTIRCIPYEDVLSLSLPDDEEPGIIDLTFAQRRGRHLHPATVTLDIDDVGVYPDLAAEIYARSYHDAKPNKRILVLVNPYGGKGRALKLFLKHAKPIFTAAGALIEVKATEYNKHAVDIARELDIEAYDLICCASGDGIPYEVYNGFFQREDRAKAFDKLPVTQIPCGSGNAMSESCLGTSEVSHAALSILKSPVVKIDLMAVTQGGETTVSFLSQTFGVIADSDLGTEHLRWMGAIRFDLGVAYKVFSRAKYPCEIFIKYCAKSKDEVRRRYNEHSGSVSDQPINEETYQLKYNAMEPAPEDWELVNQDFADNIGLFYTGAMPYVSKDVQFFPAALPNDGALDLVMMDSRTSITRQTPILLSLENGKHVQAPEIHHSKVEAFRLVPKYREGLLSVDGERYNLEELQVEVLRSAAKTILKNGSYAETNF